MTPVFLIQKSDPVLFLNIIAGCYWPLSQEECTYVQCSFVRKTNKQTNLDLSAIEVGRFAVELAALVTWPRHFLDNLAWFCRAMKCSIWKEILSGH